MKEAAGLFLRGVSQPTRLPRKGVTKRWRRSHTADARTSPPNTSSVRSGRAERAVGGRHFQVIKLLGAQPAPWRRVRLEAVLTNQCIDIDRVELKDEALWTAGWQQIVTDSSDEA